jgi:hypothetical protein
VSIRRYVASTVAATGVTCFVANVIRAHSSVRRFSRSPGRRHADGGSDVTTLNNPEATRILLVASIVLVASTDMDERKRIEDILVGLAFAGCVGVVTATPSSFWPLVAPALSLIVAAGLLVGRRTLDPVRGLAARVFERARVPIVRQG